MSLPEDFLTQLEQYEELSQRERDVFLEMFGYGKSRVQVAQHLNISESALSTCLTGIYKKFRISGTGPIKENRLREYLTKRCLQPKSSGFSSPDDLDRDIDALVQEIREKVKPNIREWCGTMRVLDMSQPIALTGERGIYTNVNILEKITGRRRLDIAELLQNCNPEDFERFGLNRVSEKRVPGLKAVEQHSKLMVLGKPGAGKTTFLKYLAMQCIEGQFQANRVPLFITLNDFAENPKQPDVLEYIAQQLSDCGVTDASVKAEQLLIKGRALVLLDGLDEVRDEGNRRVIKQIREFAAKSRDNHIVITCRIAASEYVFERFTEVEVADFDDHQISSFATQWFRVRKPTKAEKFIQKLEENKPIKELATNPLLLTLLCLIFEEKGKFKTNRAELYEEGIELLLERWDDSRDIEREQIYRNLPTRRKEDLLSKIALATFTLGNYFFKNRDAEQLISEYIYNLPDADTAPEALRVDSKKVFKSIEAQHGLLVERAKGIYSFSHLTFQEYFAAREIKERTALESLVEHITDKSWREVLLLTAGMMRNADNLVRLMKQKIDSLVVVDEKLQHFLRWVSKKSYSINVPYNLFFIRAYYLLWSLALNDSAKFRDKAVNIDLAINRMSVMNTFISDIDYFFGYMNGLTSTNNSLACTKITQDLYNTYEDFIQTRPNNNAFDKWWIIHGYAWIKKFRLALMSECFNIAKDWQFSDTQKQMLWQYYEANRLLGDCLNSDCYVSREVRHEIEDTLLLPMSEIEKRQQGKVD